MKNPPKNDYSHAVQLNGNIWWVGYFEPQDPLKCHTFLLENGTDSILIDPGSPLTFGKTLKKIEEIIPFSHIRYFLCHHADPDITASLPDLDRMISRDDAAIITSSRTQVLIKHFRVSIPILTIEELNWELNAGNRVLEFIFTPYLHFPGAFCTFDRTTGTLFSSDLFGGMGSSDNLLAEEADYFEGIKLFHEHYMPSREILYHALLQLEEYPIKQIAPQHGSIIPEKLIPEVMEKLKKLECGIYLLSQNSTEVERLSRLNQIYHDFLETLILNREFSSVADSFARRLKEALPEAELKLLAENRRQKVYCLDRSSEFRPAPCEMPDEYRFTIGQNIREWRQSAGGFFQFSKSGDKERLIFPLVSADLEIIHCLVLIDYNCLFPPDREILAMLETISEPLSIAVEREILKDTVIREREIFYEQAIRDPLTGLYTRYYMNDAVNRLFSIHDRKESSGVTLIIFDLDFFKVVNDTYGHPAGDAVLTDVSRIIAAQTRKEDILVRFGGEEFVLLLVSLDDTMTMKTAERICRAVEDHDFGEAVKGKKITISGGLAGRLQRETLTELIDRADKALYQAKAQGRNRIVRAEAPDF